MTKEKIQIVTKDIEGLFSLSAIAMVDLIQKKNPGQQITKRKIEIKATSIDNLLIKFLANVLSLVQDEFCGFAGVEFKKLTENKVVGDLLIFENPEIFAEIQNVTYQNFTLEKTDDGFLCKIIFNI